MRITRSRAVVALAGASVLLVGGCGSSDPEPAAPDAGSETSAAETSAAETSAAETSVDAADGATVYELPGSEVFPEGITADDGTFWVTSTTDGAVFRGTVGNPDVEVFLPGGEDDRSAAAGIDVDDDRLVIAGGATGTVWIYDTESGDFVGSFSNGLGEGETFVNDVAIADNGDAYITDSQSPNLWRIPADQVDSGEGGELESFVDFTGSPFEYGEGFNANGIVETGDDSALVVVQSNTGNLYRVDIESREVSPVDIGEETVANGDGLELADEVLYVTRNRDGLITTIDLDDDGSAGEVTVEVTDDSFAYPTTAAVSDDQLLVVNSQFDQRGGTPVEPFTVSGISVP